MNTADLTFLGLLAGYALGLAVVLLLIFSKTPLAKKALFSLFRMSVQLIAVGYALHWLFDLAHPLFSLLMILIMTVFSAQIILSHAEVPFRAFFPSLLAVSLLVNGTLTLFFLFLILNHTESLEPRYLIPVAGMLSGNSMNSGVIALKTLHQSITRRRDLAEQKLAFGASPKEAVSDFLSESFKLALLPTLSSMAGMGLVSLPGMMTGQILSGTSPLLAIRYQIAIMLAITASVAFGNFLILRRAYLRYFTRHLTLKEPHDRL